MEILFLVVLLVIAVAAQGALYEKHAYRHLDYRCSFSTGEATEGDNIQLVETVTNRKLLPLPWLRSEITTSEWLDYAGSQSQVTDGTRFVASYFAMRSYQRVIRSWNVKCLRRGVFPVEKCTLLSMDLLGRSSGSQTCRISAELTVLPKPADLTVTLQSVQRLSGDILVKRHYIEDPFCTAGVREYTPRDPLNRIHWPATARQGRIMVHNDLFTADQNLLILLNIQSRSYDVGEVCDPDLIEKAIRLCAGFLDDTVRSGLPVRFATNADPDGGKEPVVTHEFSGAEHVHDLMRLLARLPLRVCEPFHVFLGHACRNLQASDIVVVTAFVNNDIVSFVRERMDLGVRVKIVCPVPIDNAPVPDGCEVWCLRGEEGLS